MPLKKLSLRCNKVATRVGILEGSESSVFKVFYQLGVFGPAMFSKAIGLVTSHAGYVLGMPLEA